MNTAVKNNGLEDKVFQVNESNFIATAMAVFHFQYQNNPVYRQYCDLLKVIPGKINTITDIPFLPINFFKTHTITSTDFIPETVFESSGTTQTINSKHFVRSIGIYEESFTKGFQLFYGDVKDYCIIALLPSYLERKNSSLVLMADKLVQQSQHPKSGFYLNELEALHQTLIELEQTNQPTILIGVTFALLDFSELFPMQLKNTVIMETGGMKGRRKEMTRQEVHSRLCSAFKIPQIHSEYGMTELLSQAYSKDKGVFDCPPWMKILLRDEDDPLHVFEADEQQIKNGVINVIDLANIYSCSFIATEDAGKLYPGNSFEVLGRVDHSDIRGCSLMVL